MACGEEEGGGSIVRIFHRGGGAEFRIFYKPSMKKLEYPYTARCITRTAFLRQEGPANNIGGFVGQN